MHYGVTSTIVKVYRRIRSKDKGRRLDHPEIILVARMVLAVLSELNATRIYLPLRNLRESLRHLTFTEDSCLPVTVVL